MTTTKIKEQLQTVISELRDVLPSDKLHLASQVHELFVSYRRTCADLRRETEQAQSSSHTATQRLKDAQREVEDTASKLADVERKLAKTEQKHRQGPTDFEELATALSVLGDQMLPFVKEMESWMEDGPSPSIVLLSLSAQLKGVAWLLNEGVKGIALSSKSHNEQLAFENCLAAAFKIASIKNDVLLLVQNAMVLSESSDS